MAILTGNWKSRARSLADYLLTKLCIIAIYLLSELLIWGLSRALAPAGIPYFSSILGMLLVFGIMSVAFLFSNKTDNVYLAWIKSKIDFINAHLGVGFPIPIILIDENDMLQGFEIARIIANFLLTNLVSWAAVFAFSIWALMGVAHAVSYFKAPVRTDSSSQSQPVVSPPEQIEMTNLSAAGTATASPDNIPPSSPDAILPISAEETSVASPAAVSDCERALFMNMPPSAEPVEPPAPPKKSWTKKLFTEYYVLLFSFSCFFLIGIPLALITRDERALDGFILWFIWILTVTVQSTFKASTLMNSRKQQKHIIATLLNPVLFTTLLMTAYTRAKAAAHPSANLTQVLDTLSGGSNLYALWTSAVSGIPIPSNPSNWFGAGDLALSILEVGLLIWGFKLYECRRQLFGLAGLTNVVISTAAAACNVFLCAASGRAVGLSPQEALAFSARSVTLALAKPAVQAVAGNTVVNAALVVTNGIMGQLIYPFVLDRMGVKRELKAGEKAVVKRSAVRTEPIPVATPAGEVTGQTNVVQTAKPRSAWQSIGDDGLVTIAAGIAIGINGAAMGVAYLYGTKSRAAPHAALSMTVFGVMTVVFITVEPFRGVLTGLAGI